MIEKIRNPEKKSSTSRNKTFQNPKHSLNYQSDKIIVILYKFDFISPDAHKELNNLRISNEGGKSQ